MNEDVKRTVDVLLCAELFGATGSPPQVSLSAEGGLLETYGQRIAEREQGRPGEGALLALEALGLLPAGDADEWRQRFDLAVQGWSPSPSADAEQRRLAGEYLEWTVDLLSKATDAASRAALLDRLNGAFSVYLETGLVPPEDASMWSGRAEQALGMTVEEFELIEQAGLDPEELEELDGGAPATGALVRLVPAEPARHDGICITAVVLYEHGFKLTWHAVREGDLHSLDSFDLGRFEAADDIGTEYRPVEPDTSQWSERDGPYAVIGKSTCATAVPDEARELRIAKASSYWSIRLR